MRNFDETSISAAVLEQVRKAPSPRARVISEALVRHLHDFIREVEPTLEEWRQAIGFLTETGKLCSQTRQEFILLSDTLGASMLVDAINHRLAGGTTETTVLGPFYVDDPPLRDLGADISAGEKGEALFVHGTVTAGKGPPIAGAIVDTWHSDSEGFYDVQRYEAGGTVSMRARFLTDERGRFWFWTIVPQYYPIPDDGPVGRMLRAQGRHPYRPAHVHFMIAAPGHEKLVTHVFIAGDRYLDSDVVFGVKDSLVRPLERHPPGTAPDGRRMVRSYASLGYDFVLARSDAARAGRRKAADHDDTGAAFDFYGPQYARFGSELAAELRREVYGEDIGQQGWRTAGEQREIADQLRVGPGDRVLDVACGAGGPSLELIERTGCRLTGLDVEAAAIAHAEAAAAARGLAGQASFAVFDCNEAPPFEAGAFAAVLCIDAITHLRDRFATLSQWARLLRRGGRLVFTDSTVLTGPVAKSDLDVRAALGVFMFVPPGVNEEAIKTAGLTLLAHEDRTAAAADIAARWHAVRARHAGVLEGEEGARWFGQRQDFLAITSELAMSRRLSRFLYVAEKA